MRPIAISRLRLAARLATRLVLAAAALAPASARAQSSNPILEKFSARGPFETVRFQGGPGNAFTFFVPQPLGQDGMRHGVVGWGNGTSATPALYASLLDQFASHGFVVVAANTTNAGSGVEIRQGVDFALRGGSDPQSMFFQAVETRGACVSGHSQGARGAVAATTDPNVICAVPLETSNAPVEQLAVPTAFFYGSQDNIATPDEGRALARRILALGDAGPQLVFGIVDGATHFTPITRDGPISPVASVMAGYATAFFASQLSDDAEARTLFFGPEAQCGICRDERIAELIRSFPEGEAAP